MMRPNLLTSLRPSVVHVSMLGRHWRLVGSSAVDWAGAVGFDPLHLSGILPGMVDGEQLEEMYQLSRQVDDVEQRWFRASQVALSRASGRDWIWAYNLTLSALQGWQYLNGILLHRGIQAAQIPYADWLDAVYMLLWERSDEGDRKGLDFRLSLPPKDLGVAASPQATRAMLEAFAAD